MMIIIFWEMAHGVISQKMIIIMSIPHHISGTMVL
jgi:hypothetical protein